MTERRNSTLAIISLVSGILGWTVVPLLGTLAAIITGHMARAEIRRSDGTLEGDTLAQVGLVLGWTQVVVAVIGIAVLILFFGGLAFFAAHH